MTTYYVGDRPAQPVVVVPDRDGDELDLDGYATAEALLLDGAGTTTPCPAVIVAGTEDEGGHVEITLPLLEHAGLAQLHLQLSGPDGPDATQDTFEAEPFVVQDRTRWHSLASARLEWEGARALEDVELWVLLETARLECAAYGRALEPADERWASYRRAQLMHARNRNAAARVDPATGDGGTESFGLGAFPLDWTVKQLLRPEHRLRRVR